MNRVPRRTAADRIDAVSTIKQSTCPEPTVVSKYLGLMTQLDYGRLLPAQVVITRTFRTFLLRVHGVVNFVK